MLRFVRIGCIVLLVAVWASAPGKTLSRATDTAATKPPVAVELHLERKGTRDFIRVAPPGHRLELWLGKRRIASLPGGPAKSRFDVTAQVRQAAGRTLRAIAFLGTRKAGSRNFRIADEAATSTVESKPPSRAAGQSGADPHSSQRNGRLSIATSDELQSPRQTTSGKPTGSRAPAAALAKRPSPPPVRTATRPRGAGLPGGAGRGLHGGLPDSGAEGTATGATAPARARTGLARPGRAGAAAAGGGAAPAGARIISADGAPIQAQIGAPLILRGEGFGASGRAELAVAGVRSRASTLRWSDTEVQVAVSSALAPLVGDEAVSGRVWLYAEDGIATASLTIRPDPATLVPSVERAPTSVSPGDVISLQGRHFFDAPGAVTLRCGSTSYTGLVSSWSATRIDVDPLGRFDARPRSADCELVVRNRYGQSGRRGVRLDVRLERLELTQHVSRNHDFRLRNSLRVYTRLHNGWEVIDHRIVVDPDRGLTVGWAGSPPARGDQLVDNYLEAEFATRVSGGGPRHVMIEWTVEGPAGLPLNRPR